MCRQKAFVEVGIIYGTGTVGQRPVFVLLSDKLFQITFLAYEQLMENIFPCASVYFQLSTF